ncbi:MAG: acyl-CoA dehydrogenase family protein, partial [Myxococcota bacterium]|nr:acyl-CoA dehydrogenase family protein [Myxococcota bacterium]
MDFAFTDEQREIRESARAFLADHSASAQVRAAMEGEAGFDAEVWKRIGSELGWPAIPVPEDCGGLGLGDVELAALLEVTGEWLLCAPLFATAALAVPVVLEVGGPEDHARLLPALAEGRCTATLLHPGPSGRWGGAGVQTVAEPRADGGARLTGRAPWVVDGHTADLLLVPARAPGSGRGEGV